MDKAEYMRKYRAEHKEQFIEYRKLNREVLNQRAREWYANNKERVRERRSKRIITPIIFHGSSKVNFS